jgi:hypothetical protein
MRRRADLMLGSRFLGSPLAGGMPRWKYVSNRFLTGVENLVFGLRLSEYHTGLRAYSRACSRRSRTSSTATTSCSTRS